MSQSTWQLAAALVFVAAAVAALALRVYRMLRGQSAEGCGSGGCGTCPSADSPAGVQERPLVQLGLGNPPRPLGSDDAPSRSTSLER